MTHAFRIGAIYRTQDGSLRLLINHGLNSTGVVDIDGTPVAIACHVDANTGERREEGGYRRLVDGIFPVRADDPKHRAHLVPGEVVHKGHGRWVEVQASPAKQLTAADRQAAMAAVGYFIDNGTMCECGSRWGQHTGTLCPGGQRLFVLAQDVARQVPLTVEQIREKYDVAQPTWGEQLHNKAQDHKHTGVVQAVTTAPSEIVPGVTAQQASRNAAMVARDGPAIQKPVQAAQKAVQAAGTPAPAAAKPALAAFGLSPDLAPTSHLVAPGFGSAKL